jgi:hypothetical protein
MRLNGGAGFTCPQAASRPDELESGSANQVNEPLDGI